MSNTIIKADFVNKRVMKVINMQGQMCEIDRIYYGVRSAFNVTEKTTVLEAVGRPVVSNIDQIFKKGRVARFAYDTEGADPELASQYMSMIPPKADYHVVILNGIAEAMSDKPFILIHKWPDFLLRCIFGTAVVYEKTADKLIKDFIHTTMKMSFKTVHELTKDQREGDMYEAVLGLGIR